MKKLILLLSLTAIAVFIAAGCGDDDCPNCPSEVDTVVIDQEYLVYLDGFVTLTPETWLDMDGFGAGGAIPHIDSFAVGDSVSTDYYATNWWYARDPYFYLTWDEDVTPPYMYESGDLATVTVWGDNRSSSATVTILDWENDYPEMLVPSGTDTIVPPANDMEFSWSRVALAEWYAVQIYYELDSLGVTIESQYIGYTYDTTFTVSSSYVGYPVDLGEIYVVAITGPDPESGIGNWEGDYASGKLYSIGGESFARVSFQGVTASKPVVQFEEPMNERSLGETIKALRAGFRQ